MKVLVTGTPGTGKTTNARDIAAAMKLPYVNVTSIINTHPEMVESVENGVRVIKPQLKKLLEKSLPSSYVIDTHLIEYVPDVNVVVVLRCEPFELKKRLEARHYSNEKIKENIEAEMLNYFSSSTAKKNVVEIDTSKTSSDENVKKIVKMIKEKKWNKGAIKWENKKYAALLK
jgi:adenylate kinase